MQLRTRRVLTILALVLAGTVALSAWYLDARLRPAVEWLLGGTDRAFDRPLWIISGSGCSSDNMRGPMTAALAQQLLATRPKREEVRALLGAPDYDLSTPNDTLRYSIGMWSGLRMDCDSFDVAFDSTGRVSAARVIQH